MSDLGTVAFDNSEKIDILIKENFNVPSTNENTQWYLEDKVPFNTYVNGKNILLDEIPNSVDWNNASLLSDQELSSIYGLSSSDFYTGGGVKKNSTGILHKFIKLKLQPIPGTTITSGSTTTYFSYYHIKNGVNLLENSFQLNHGDGTSFVYLLYSENNIASDVSILQDSNGGNWFFNFKNGIVFVPDPVNSSVMLDAVNQNKLPYFTFVKYVGRKGISKQITISENKTNITSPENNQIAVQTSDNKLYRYESSTDNWINIGGGGGGTVTVDISGVIRRSQIIESVIFNYYFEKNRFIANSGTMEGTIWNTLNEQQNYDGTLIEYTDTFLNSIILVSDYTPPENTTQLSIDYTVFIRKGGQAIEINSDVYLEFCFKIGNNIIDSSKKLIHLDLIEKYVDINVIIDIDNTDNFQIGKINWLQGQDISLMYRKIHKNIIDDTPVYMNTGRDYSNNLIQKRYPILKLFAVGEKKTTQKKSQILENIVYNFENSESYFNPINTYTNINTIFKQNIQDNSGIVIPYSDDNTSPVSWGLEEIIIKSYRPSTTAKQVNIKYTAFITKTTFDGSVHSNGWQINTDAFIEWMFKIGDQYITPSKNIIHIDLIEKYVTLSAIINISGDNTNQPEEGIINWDTELDISIVSRNLFNNRYRALYHYSHRQGTHKYPRIEIIAIGDEAVITEDGIINSSMRGGGGTTIEADNTDPTQNISEGDLFINTSENILKRYNGSSWIDIGSNNIWNISGNDTFYTNGNVGIGTTDPQALLHIAHINAQSNEEIVSLRAEGTIRTYATNADGHIRSELTAHGQGGKLQLYDGWDPNEVIRVKLSAISNEDNYINNGGNVGIGKTNPNSVYKLDVNGNIGLDGNYLNCNNSNGLVINGGNVTNKNVALGGPQPSANNGYPLYVNGGNVSVPSSHVSITNYDSTYGNLSLYRIGVNSGYITTSGSDKYYLVRSGSPSDGGTGSSISIRAQNSIMTTYIYFSSDQRIKKDIVEISDSTSLHQLRNINVTTYKYKDEVGRGNGITYGFIAQQVAEHFPDAVNLKIDTVPNEMRLIENPLWSQIVDGSQNKFKLTIPDLEDVSGGTLYRFYMSNDVSGNDECLKETRTLDDDPKSFIFDQSWNNVFLYGKEVYDFHILDKNKLYTINFSATQEIDRIQQQQLLDISENALNIELNSIEIDKTNDRIVNLENNNNELKQKINNLEIQNNDLLTRLQALEKKINEMSN